MVKKQSEAVECDEVRHTLSFYRQLWRRVVIKDSRFTSGKGVISHAGRPLIDSIGTSTDTLSARPLIYRSGSDVRRVSGVCNFHVERAGVRSHAHAQIYLLSRPARSRGGGNASSTSPGPHTGIYSSHACEGCSRTRAGRRPQEATARRRTGRRPWRSAQSCSASLREAALQRVGRQRKTALKERG